MKKNLLVLSVVALLSGAAQAEGGDELSAAGQKVPAVSIVGDTVDYMVKYQGLVDSFLKGAGIDDRDYKILMVDKDNPKGATMLIDKLKIFGAEWQNVLVSFYKKVDPKEKDKIASMTFARTIEKHGMNKASQDYKATIKSISEKYAPEILTGKEECKKAFGEMVCFSDLRHGKIRYEVGFDLHFFMVKISENPAL